MLWWLSFDDILTIAIRIRKNHDNHFQAGGCGQPGKRLTIPSSFLTQVSSGAGDSCGGFCSHGGAGAGAGGDGGDGSGGSGSVEIQKDIMDYFQQKHQDS